MKGKMRVSVEFTNEVGNFPITEKWSYEVDNTYEGIDNWVDLFNKILAVQGFHAAVDVVDDEEGYYGGEYSEESGV